MISQTISHYRITAKLGEGGMGVVYRAEDTKLERTVALKFLAAHLLHDQNAHKRFTREAKAAAVLRHANICPVYEIDEVDDRIFIVMPFIEGQSLDQKIEAGPLNLAEALDIARQTAEGLHDAHAHSIVHRDIKPQNLLISPRPDGQHTVTIMDFGLAYLTEQSKLTQKNASLGTVGYMSPEQTVGGEVDHRTDIWALGCVLYEMIRGQQPFRGHYTQAVTYSILNEDPEPLTAVRSDVPMELEWLVNKCLAKDPTDRYHSTEELTVDLRAQQRRLRPRSSAPGSHRATARATRQLSAGHEPDSVALGPASPTAMRSLKRQRTLLVVGLVLSLAFGLSLWIFGPESRRSPGAVRKFTFVPPSNVSDPAISPDGRYIAYLAGTERTLWIQELAENDLREIEGTRGSAYPFWSAASESIAFGTGNELKKVPVGGGSVLNICRMPDQPFQGGSFSPEGDSIVFSAGGVGKLYEVAARSGSPQLLLEHAENKESYVSPRFLPNSQGRRLLMYVEIGAGGASRIVVRDLDSGNQQDLGSGAWPAFSPSGHVLFESGGGVGNLWALPFSLTSATVVGEPFSVAAHAQRPSVAADQTLVYLDDSGIVERQLVWRARNGDRIEIVGQPLAELQFPVLSRDDRFVAVRGTVDGNSDIWVYSFSRGDRNRITADPDMDLVPAWSASGAELAFASHRNGNWDIWTKPVEGTGQASELVATPDAEGDADWSADGRYLLFVRIDPTTNRDIWYLRRGQGSEQEAVPFVQTPFDEGSAKFSPDGLYVAYVSNESGGDQVYIRPFSGGRRIQVSIHGGGQPRWRRDGKELFFVSGDTLMAAPVKTQPEFEVGTPEKLFRAAALVGSFSPQYDVAGDGKRFILAEPVREGSNRVIRLVQNWYEEFRDHEKD